MNNKKISRLLTLFAFMFLSLIVYLTAFDLTNHDKYAVETITEREDHVIRGKVFDRNKEIFR